MKRYLLVYIYVFLHICSARAQETFPVNGVQNKNDLYYAFTNATIYADYQTVIKNGTLLIRDGKIEKCGTNVVIPKGCISYDLKGKYIYPSLVDIYTQYGISEIKAAPRSDPQIESATKGAYNFNQAVKPEIDAIKIFSKDEKAADELRKMGFGAVLSFNKDGIVRGSGTFVTLSDAKENNSVVLDRASANYSFDKGTSGQDYPSSLTGSIALLRQTFLDAEWYKNAAGKDEYNISLNAFNNNYDLPSIFEARDKFNILRADKVGDEFKKQFIIKGNGDEYQRINEIKNTHAALIIPVNFPPVPEVEDPYDASHIELEELKHWEMAPANLAALEKAQIPFAITAADLKDKKDFWTNLRKAIEYGLSEKEALKSLTYQPATILGVATKTGSLKEGMLANFLITSTELFDKKNIIYENWIQGKCFKIKDYNIIDIRGEYELMLAPDKKFQLKITGDIAKPKGTVVKDTAKMDATISLSNNLITLTFNYKKEGYYRLSGTIIRQEPTEMSGHGEFPAGDRFSWTAVYKEPGEKEKADTLKTENIEIGKLLYPNLAYGFEELPQAEDVLIKNATVWTNEQEGILKNTDVLISKGKIARIGKNIDVRAAKIIDGTNKYLTSGIIDEHSHIAICNGVNESGQAISAEVRMGDVINSDDINIYRHLAGGVTVTQILHGSANPIGGQSALVKMRWGSAPEEMKIAGADGFIKFALGENVKQSNWGDRQTVRFPQTRMGVEQVFIDAFNRAREYEEKLRTPGPLNQVRRDLELDALVEILNKKRFITCHSYVQSEINMLMHVADSFGFKINTFTHVLEGYKVADKIKAHGAGASTFSDWWAYKMEVMDAIPYNGALLNQMKVVTAYNSDDAEMARRLNQEAAKAVKYGNTSEEDAWKFVTLNPAKLLHLDDRMGSIKAGKDADLVLWSDNPLSIYSKAEKTFVDGILYYDINRDLQLRGDLQKERARIIQKMIIAKKGGEKTQKTTPKKPKLYRCESDEDEGREEGF